MKRKKKDNEIKAPDEHIGIVEIFGKRVYWVRLGRNKSAIYTTESNKIGSNTVLYDMRFNNIIKLMNFKDTRRTCKYYYDWGEIDRLIYKYYREKALYRVKKNFYVEAKDLPDEIIQIRNDIVESLFNLIKTIIYTHSFHQQMNDLDLFQDSVEKLIRLLDDDKHNPVRGTSFTFFTIALKNMIFTQLKKNKRYAISTDNIKPFSDTGLEMEDSEDYSKDVYELFTPTFMDDTIESEFIEE